MRKFKIKGETPGEKFQFLEAFLGRIQARGSGNVIVGVIPPSLIHHYVDKIPVDGTLFKCLIPARGRLSKGCLVVKKDVGKVIKVDCRIERAAGGIHTVIETKKPIIIESLGLDVEAGDMLSMVLEDPTSVKNAWISILYEISIENSQIKRIAFEELNNLTEDIIDGQ